MKTRSVPARRTLAVATLATALLGGAAAHAQDIALTQAAFVGTPQAGNCNQMQVAIQNTTGQLLNTITGVTVITFPSNTPNQNRSQRSAFFSALQPNQTQSRTIQGIDFLGGTGVQHTVQVLADFQQQVDETNESNNLQNQFVTPSQTCEGGVCDLKAEQMGPFQSSLPGTYPANVAVTLRNIGGAQCPSQTLTFKRYQGSSASGTPTVLGTATLQAASPNQARSAGYQDSSHPTSGTFTYSYEFAGGNPDDNPSNDLLTKTVTFNPPPTPSTDQRGGNPAGCDLQASFGTPTGSTFPGGQAIAWEIKFQNNGKAACNATKFRLNRFTSSTCSGYGSFVGGSGAIQAIGGLAPGQSATAVFSERPTPRKGPHCYKLAYTGAFNDDNNFNHHPERKVSFN